MQRGYNHRKKNAEQLPDTLTYNDQKFIIYCLLKHFVTKSQNYN